MYNTLEQENMLALSVDMLCGCPSSLRWRMIV